LEPGKNRRLSRDALVHAGGESTIHDPAAQGWGPVTVRVGLIGAGLMGSRRAASIAASKRSQLLAVADLVEDKAAELARQ